MPALSTELRRRLEKMVVDARDAAEMAAVGALKSLAFDQAEPFSGMSEEDREFRRVLRARARQLGSFYEPLDASEGFALLVSEIAYEQWHRMLFARFLAENNLLIHPAHGVPVTLAECAELATTEGEPDEWMLAARYAGQMLPGIFRTADPAVRVRFAPEGRQALERILSGLPAEVFIADDSLGWVYQFWQSKRKKEVNASERKIGGADLPPVTQLFTEHYMVSFLLENSLGAWWAGKHPESQLLTEWEYLRFAEDGTPAAGTFDGWPEAVADVTMMDPCCGSGHFLVAGFGMLRRMREEEDGLTPRDAADAVLRDNLFGLELDGRCVQIAVFALALAAWKVGGYRQLPPMNIACSGVPARGTVQEWRALAQGDDRLAAALERLHDLFKDADTLGSLIDPKRAAESDTLLGVDYEAVAPLLHQALKRYGGNDPAQQVFVQAAADVASAAKLLADRYTLVATNPPYLGRRQQDPILLDALERLYPLGKTDLATAMLLRLAQSCDSGGSTASVTPVNWLSISSYERLRMHVLQSWSMHTLAVLGPGAFVTISGEVVRVCLLVASPDRLHRGLMSCVDVSLVRSAAEKSTSLRNSPMTVTTEGAQLNNADSRIMCTSQSASSSRLDEYAHAYKGMNTGDDPRLRRFVWEAPAWETPWARMQSGPDRPGVSGCSSVVWLSESKKGLPASYALRSREPWGKRGVALGHVGKIKAGPYLGVVHDQSVASVIPRNERELPALAAFLSSASFERLLRQIDSSVKVTEGSLLKVPFDLEHWTKVAAEEYPDGLPAPHSEDPTQWLFKGNIVGSESPLHVAVARLLDYSWPDQQRDELDRFSDSDGIVCLPPIGGERPAADRLLELLAAAYGDTWSQSVLEGLLSSEGSSDLESWLRDEFFASHCRLFGNRPFIWQVWDGRKDGFSALVNYHKLDRRLLERLIYTTVQSWIDRQKADAERGVGGAEARQSAADELKSRLELILEGEPPYDIYVRWKPLDTQPTGWDPDPNDGVRLNIRPFVEGGVLRSKFTVNWNKDRGRNSDGSERLNDLHYTVAQKREARARGTAS